MTNANHPRVRDLYPRFRRKVFQRSSTLASDVDKRCVVSEVILYSP